ncbi:methionine aminotransferase [Marivirga atlantica]|uniref:Aminotransferase class I/II-fold pyridoxal phosphate-dependent enzyme n=1 Tax=Marivirga atlantica TaxID=1548457 RepID=A0A937DI56_9BACT|nr:methionine aminotransferase [Marivirga atlantica]MBL0764690.1 aminotransferase class I/II-fold pyridoxal phosphate-dependent enzyme [Marivirga atlantica]
MNIASKLPSVGTTIFTVMSQMAAEHNAINLSQGFPEFPISEELIELVYRNMQMGHNQYAPMPGLPALREEIAQKIAKLYQTEVNPDEEITVTAGATEAIFSTIMALVNEGEEVVVLEPAYDCYIPAIELAGGVPKTVALNPKDFTPDWEKIRDTITEKTRMLVINTPHNPSGAVFSPEDIKELKALLEQNPNLLILSDEVYEHIIFDDKPHLGVLADQELAKRSIAVYSFGKTFHATGWKIGYLVAPTSLTKEIRKVHQYNCFSVNTPAQFALAEFLKDESNYQGIGEMYQKKRDYFVERLAASKFKVIPSYGTYFQILNYDNVSQESDVQFAERLTKEYGLASIPVSAFYQQKTDNKMLRFCFAKGEETLEKAADILCKI